MEVKLFVYDKTLRPDTFLNTFKLSSVNYEPCFSYVRLMRYKNRHFAIEEGFSNFPNFTYGTLYSFNCTEIEWENIKLFYMGNGELRLGEIEVRTISFNSIEDFLNHKFEVTSVQKVNAFISDLSNKQMKSIALTRVFYAYNLCKDFLQVYK